MAKAIEAKELDGLDEAELKRVVNETSIFARAEPRHKVLILRTLKEYHDVVLMTGDGVKDAPALRNADVGVAMGIKGADVARDTSDMCCSTTTWRPSSPPSRRAAGYSATSRSS